MRLAALPVLRTIRLSAPMTIIGLDIEAHKVLLDDMTECPIIDLIGTQAVVQLPNGSFCVVDTAAPKMTKQ